MKQEYLRLLLFFMVITTFSLSCRKENQVNHESFYGRWQTSYGDTIIFSKVNGGNILSYNVSLNASLPAHTQKEFTYQDNKLGINDGWGGPGDFRFLHTFKWQQPGKSFEVQGIEWFSFLSSTLTWYKFTKIP